jgi:hypothetical protein
MAQSKEPEVMTNAENVAVAAIRKPRKKPEDNDDIVSNKQLSTGSLAIQRRLGIRYGMDEIQSIEIPNDFEGQVELARTMYSEEGMVKTVIDLMTAFSCTGMKNIATKPKSQKFFDNMCKYSDMDSLFRWIFLEFYLTGDVFIYRGDKQVVKSGPDKGAVYYNYTVMNPLSIDVVGDLMFGGEAYLLKLPDSVRRVLQMKKGKEYTEIMSKLPKALRKADLITKDGNILLPKDRVSRICYNKQPYERRPTPFIAGAFAPLMLKRRLREMDLSTAEGSINSLMVITVGNDKFPATKKQLEAIAELFQTGAKSYQLFWNHTLKVEKIEADLSALNDSKYSQINKDIAASLGMPSVLINGGDESGRFANAWASIVALIERLDAGRDQVLRWQETEYRLIAEENNIIEIPSVEFERMNLREEKVYKDLLLQQYDRGLLDRHRVLEEGGFDYDQVKTQKELEKKDDKLFESPYAESGAPVPPPVPKAPAAPKPQSGKPGGEGRPKNELNPDYTQRPPQEGPRQTSEPPPRMK